MTPLNDIRRDEVEKHVTKQYPIDFRSTSSLSRVILRAIEVDLFVKMLVASD